MPNPYNSTPETLEHIEQVRLRLDDVIVDLCDRWSEHDASKLEEPELHYFNKYTPLLKDTVYGSDEYKGYLEELKPALDHHYEVNDHHPEHFENGMYDMDLVQMIEMLADWKAATLRTKDGNLDYSIGINRDRFGYGEEVEQLLRNTAKRLGWL